MPTKNIKNDKGKNTEKSFKIKKTHTGGHRLYDGDEYTAQLDKNEM